MECFLLEDGLRAWGERRHVDLLGALSRDIKENFGRGLKEEMSLRSWILFGYGDGS